jgi:hypothetical protein
MDVKVCLSSLANGGNFITKRLIIITSHQTLKIMENEMAEHTVHVEAMGNANKIVSWKTRSEISTQNT